MKCDACSHDTDEHGVDGCYHVSRQGNYCTCKRSYEAVEEGYSLTKNIYRSQWCDSCQSRIDPETPYYATDGDADVLCQHCFHKLALDS